MPNLEGVVAEVVSRYVWLAQPQQGLPMDRSFIDLGIDSMSIIRIAMDLEQELQVAIPDSFFTSEVFATPGTLQSSLKELLHRGSW